MLQCRPLDTLKRDALQHYTHDAEFYNWIQVPTPVSDADKEWWCSEDAVGGLPVLDCKVFK